MLDLGVEIRYVDVQGQTDLLDLHNMLVFPGFLFPFRLLEAIFAVIHDFADGRVCVGNYLNKIEFLFVCDSQRMFNLDNTKLFAFFVDESNLFVTDLLIDQQFLSCYGFHHLERIIQTKNALPKHRARTNKMYLLPLLCLHKYLRQVRSGRLLLEH